MHKPGDKIYQPPIKIGGLKKDARTCNRFNGFACDKPLKRLQVRLVAYQSQS